VSDLVGLLIQRNTAAMELQVQVTRMKVARRKHGELVEKVQAVCDHPEHLCEETSQYHSGGYDYRSYTSYQIHCKQCGKLIADWDGELGSFG